MWKKWTLGLVGILVLAILVLVGSIFLQMKRDEGKFPALVTDAKVGKRLLFQHVDVYPGKGHERLMDRDVLIVGDAIESIAAGGTLATANAHVIQGQGHTLLPGLVDTHVHLMSSGAAPWRFMFGSIQHNLQAYLRAGVTTVFDLGGMGSVLKDARQKVRSGAWLGPQFFHTHLQFTVPGAHPAVAASKMLPWPMNWLANKASHQIEDVADIAPIMASLKAQKVDYIKVIRDRLPPGAALMKPAILKAILREAKKRGLPSFVHIGDTRDALLAAEAGADVLAHMIRKGPLTKEQAQRLAKSGVKMIPTLYGFQVTARLAEGKYQPSALERAIHPDFLWKPLAGASGARFLKTPALGEFAKELIAQRASWAAHIRTLHQAGVPLLIGTDSALPAVFPGSSFHLELHALEQAGIPRHALLEAATSGGAAMLNKAPGFGQLAPKMRADLLLVKGNPLTSLAHLRQIKAVVARGRLLRWKQ